MGRVCTVCALPREQREAIDKALVGGMAVREISRRYAPLSATSLRRHRDEHIAPAVAAAQAHEDVEHGLDVVKQLRTINGVTMTILSEARQQRNPDVALKAIDRIQRQIELQAKLLGDLDERPQINLTISVEWQRARAVLLAALQPHTEARIAVAAALMQLEAGS